MTAPTVLLVLTLGLTVAGLAGLHTLIEYAEHRRRIRWAHTLARFCGDPACGLCRSRRLSPHIPCRSAGRSAGRSVWLVGG